jgi:glycosyltransferase involved in cell wall biosynthesis
MVPNKEQRMEYSIIVPVYNEDENLCELYERVTHVMKKKMNEEKYEIIFVDDGSTDCSYDLMAKFHQKDKHVKAIRFTKNFGQHPALIAGLRRSMGEKVILLDADLQYPPEEIPRLVEKLNEGYDCVFANRAKQAINPVKKIVTRILFSVLGSFLGNLLSTQLTSFKIFNRKLVNAILENIQNARILTGLSVWMGYSHVGIDVQYLARTRGFSKYNYRKLFSFLLELVTGYSTVPLRLASYSGLLIATFGFALSTFFFIKKIFYGIGVPGYASLIITITFFSGVQLLALGVIGEYIGRIVREVQRRPPYIVGEVLE